MERFKYFAFISYNSADLEWGKSLQRKLEHYKLPATLCQNHNLPPEPIKPVFFAPTDIQPGGLSKELQERLQASQHLIVICSPNSAKSVWVGREIEFFHNLGRTENIHFFIIDGIPFSGNPRTECYNPVVEKLGIPEILGANIHEKIYRLPWLNRERAFVQLVSKLLGVEFDAIWQRQKRHLINKIVVYSMLAIATISALVGVWINNRPEDVTITLNDTSLRNENLPPLRNAEVTMFLDNEIRIDTIKTIDSNTIFSNVPHHLLNKKIRFKMSCRNYIDIDTILTLSKNMVIDIERDPLVYGQVRFRLYNPDVEKGVANVQLQIDGYNVISDENGVVSLFIPLESQNTFYLITTDVELKNDSVIMPCGDQDIVETK